MFHFILFLLLITFNATHASYILKESKRELSKIDKMPKKRVADMWKIPQKTSFYASQIKSFSKEKQKKHDKAYNKNYFKPWSLTKLDIPTEDIGWEVRFIEKKPIYREKGKKIAKKEYQKWITNANYKNIDRRKYKAITIKRTNLKALPTSQSFYHDPKKTGEGFPFDYNQNSSLHINVPLYISHYSKDRRWVFVRASYAFGWMRVSDMAVVNNIFKRKFKNNHYGVSIKDNLRIYDTKNKPISLVKLGAIFPISKDKKSYFLATKNPKGNAVVRTLKVENPNLIATKPLQFSAKNVAKVAQEFYNEPYGWGGGYECRDCSATTRDFMGVFGIFLQRNSSKQALAGSSISLKGLSKESKKRKIIQKAKPFASLLYVPGHIVLYLGEYKGEPIIMHTYWGIRKKNLTKIVTGRTIISSTEPGKERKDVREKSKLINTLQSIINL